MPFPTLPYLSFVTRRQAGFRLTTNEHEYGTTRRTTDLKLANFPRELAATLAALPSTSPIPSAPFTDVRNGEARVL
jgi:hypothetical protein